MKELIFLFILAVIAAGSLETILRWFVRQKPSKKIMWCYAISFAANASIIGATLIFLIFGGWENIHEWPGLIDLLLK